MLSREGGLAVADALEDRVGAEAAGELPHAASGMAATVRGASRFPCVWIRPIVRMGSARVKE